MPFIEHYNILKPLLLPLASDPVYAQFLQQARKMAITPISEKALEETTLTPREQLIISRVRDGWTNKEIADELTVAEVTNQETSDRAVQEIPRPQQDAAPS